MNSAPPTTKTPSVALRPVDEGDEQFLFQVYASTRAEELAQVGWSDSQKESFLEMQFRAQSRYYESEYPGAEFRIILVGGQPAGRLYVHRRENEILGEGARTSRRVTIHVEIFNPALRLYERLGFRQVGSNGVYHLLEWTPARSRLAAQTVPSQNQ